MKTLITCLLILVATPVAADAVYDGLLACVAGNVPTELRAQDIEITSTDRGGNARTLHGHLYAQRSEGLTRATILITRPQNIAGSAYLIRETRGQEDDMYVWLPAVRRVRHITGSFANGSLLGTDFSYAEAKLIENTFADAEGALDGSDAIEGRPAKIVRLTPRQKDSPYTRIRAWVDDQTCLVMRTEFEHDDKLIKRLSGPVSALAQSGSHWYLSRMEMEDLAAGTQTELSVRRINGENTAAIDHYFDPTTFYQVR